MHSTIAVVCTYPKYCQAFEGVKNEMGVTVGNVSTTKPFAE